MAMNIPKRTPIESTGTSTLEQNSLIDSASSSQYGLEGKQIGSNASASIDRNLISDADKGKVLGRIGSFFSNLGSFLKGDNSPAENLGGGLSTTQSNEPSDPVKMAEERATLAFLNNPGNFLGKTNSFGVPVSSFLSEGDNWLNKSNASTNNETNGGTASEADFLNNPGVMLGSDSGLARYSKLDLSAGGTSSTEVAKIDQPNNELSAQQNIELSNEANQLSSNLTTDNQPLKTTREIATIAESKVMGAAEVEPSPLGDITDISNGNMSPFGSFGSDSSPALVDPKTGEIIAEPDLNTMGKMGLLGKPGSDRSPESIEMPKEMGKEAPVTTLPEPDQASQPLVGVIDTGFNVAEANINRGNISLGWDRVGQDGDPLLKAGEGSAHGTHILSTIAAKQDEKTGVGGINPQAPLWLGRAVGSGEWANSLVEFVDAAKASGQKNAVANLSFDLTQKNIDGSVSTRAELTPQEEAALTYAQENKILVVVAAGNQNGEMSGLGKASLRFDNVISVGSVSADRRADYSSHGEGLDVVTDGGTPQDPVLSRMGDGIGAMAGTSVSAAQVTGVLSKVWAANPELNYQQVADILAQSAIDKDIPGWDTQTGFGKVDEEAAIALARNTTAAELKTPESNGVVPASFNTELMLEQGAIASERAADFEGGGFGGFDAVAALGDFTGGGGVDALAGLTGGGGAGIDPGAGGGGGAGIDPGTGGGGGVDPGTGGNTLITDGGGGIDPTGGGTGGNGGNDPGTGGGGTTNLSDNTTNGTGAATGEALTDTTGGTTIADTNITDPNAQTNTNIGEQTAGGGDPAANPVTSTDLGYADEYISGRGDSDSSSETISSITGNEQTPATESNNTPAIPNNNPEPNPAITPSPSPSPSPGEAVPSIVVPGITGETESSDTTYVQSDADQAGPTIDPFADTGNNLGTTLADSTTTNTTETNLFDNSPGNTTDNGATVNNTTGLDNNNSAGDTIAGSTATDNFFANSGGDLLNNSPGDNAIALNGGLTNNSVNPLDNIAETNSGSNFTPIDIGVNNATGELGDLFGGYTNESGSAIAANNFYDIANGKPLDISDRIFNEIGNANSPLTYKFADENPTLVAQIFNPNNSGVGGAGKIPVDASSIFTKNGADALRGPSPQYSVGEAFGRAVGNLPPQNVVPKAFQDSLKVISSYTDPVVKPTIEFAKNSLGIQQPNKPVANNKIDFAGELNRIDTLDRLLSGSPSAANLATKGMGVLGGNPQIIPTGLSLGIAAGEYKNPSAIAVNAIQDFNNTLSNLSGGASNPNANSNTPSNFDWNKVIDDPHAGEMLTTAQTIQNSADYWGKAITQSEPYGIFTGAAAAAARYWAQEDAKGNGLAWIPGVAATWGDADHLPGTVFTVGTVGLGSSVGGTKAGQAILSSPLLQSLFAFDTGLNLGQAGTGKDLEGNELPLDQRIQKGISGLGGLIGLDNQPIPTNKTNSVADDLVPNSPAKPSLDPDGNPLQPNTQSTGNNTPFVSTQTGDTGKNATLLRGNMTAEGQKFNPRDEAHHIVPSTHSRAQQPRDILDKYHVDINDAANGIALPNSLHHGHGLHSHQGIDEVREMLSQARSAEDVKQILNAIKQDIIDGKFPSNNPRNIDTP